MDPEALRLVLDKGFLRGEEKGVRWRGSHANCRHKEIALQVLYEAVMDYRPEVVGIRMMDALEQAEKALGIR